MPTLTRLIKKIASNPSTEELILFIADNDEMVRECVGLQKRLETSNSRELDDLDALCRNHHISLEMLAREVGNILAIFAPDSISNEYAVLGLAADADLKQVKDAFRKLSIKYHPDSSGSSNSDRFIEICQAYKTIISRPGTDKLTTSSGRTPSWRYTKKRGLSARQKRRNIYFFSALALILVIISIIAPFVYKKRVMLNNLNSSNPLLADRAEHSQTQPAAPEEKQQPVSDHTAAESEYQAVSSELQDEIVANNITSDVTDTETQPPAPLQQQAASSPPEDAGTISLPEPEEQPPAATSVTSSPEPEILTLTSESKKQKPADHISRDEKNEQPPQSTTLKPEIITLQPASSKYKPTPSAARVKSEQPPPVTRIHELEIQSPKSTLIDHELSNHSNSITGDTQPAANASQNPEAREINDFIHDYTRAYESKDLQQFSRFFTKNALENGTSFAKQHDRYIELFNSVDTILLNINILSTSMIDDDIQLRGRFRIRLTYPHKQPIRKTGQIFFLLTGNNQQYLVKELGYAFDKTE